MFATGPFAARYFQQSPGFPSQDPSSSCIVGVVLDEESGFNRQMRALRSFFHLQP
jgi:hypothetical protein